MLTIHSVYGTVQGKMIIFIANLTVSVITLTIYLWVCLKGHFEIKVRRKTHPECREKRAS